jgi:hypothetical protein
MARAEPLAVGAARDCLRFKRAGGVGRPAACGPVMELGRDVVHARSEQVVDGMITRHLRRRGSVERLKICHRCIFLGDDRLTLAVGSGLKNALA